MPLRSVKTTNSAPRRCAHLLGQRLQHGGGIDAAVGRRHRRELREAAGNRQHAPGVRLPDLLLLQVRGQEPGGDQCRQHDGHLHREQLDRQREGASHAPIVPQAGVRRTTTNTTSTTAMTRGLSLGRLVGLASGAPGPRNLRETKGTLMAFSARRSTPLRHRRRLLTAVVPAVAAGLALSGCSGTVDKASTDGGSSEAVSRLQIMAPADPGGGWDQTARAMSAAFEGAKLAEVRPRSPTSPAPAAPSASPSSRTRRARTT